MSTHLPVRISRPLYRQCVFHRPCGRPFSTTIIRHGRSGKSSKKRFVDSVQTEALAQQQGRKGKASSTIHEEQLKDERNIPDDIGLLPGTFIRAPFRKVLSASSWKKPGTLPWYYWKLLESKGKAWLLLWRFRKVSPKCPPLHWNPLNRSAMNVTAVEKYKYLYKSFALGNTKAVSELCISTVAKKFQDRIAARPAGLKMEWSTSVPKATIVSNRALTLSLVGYENTGIQQIVFRVTSKSQILDLRGGSAQVNGGGSYKSNVKEGTNVVEYLVLQRQVLRGEFKKWAVWGFTNEWVPETIKEDEEYERNVSAYQAESV